ncbi:hypothetical protein GSI_02286 [Ganoderma sinense ZZ0214-1]|uniref:Uncharacterized protein n=1 Tax=Ganoderma sinense ZZ0214-1 TaxID=1077348 RepID=A0A2G8SPQ6_9APHY|nr:hypothetical protein GSI_02286 [Ganoderma sinense ZZ0214-1]
MRGPSGLVTRDLPPSPPLPTLRPHLLLSAMAPVVHSTTSSNSSRSAGDAAASSQRQTNLEQFSPSFHVVCTDSHGSVHRAQDHDCPQIQGECIDVQIRTYIWVPGVVTRIAYFEPAASLVYEIRYVAADGSTLVESFYPRDVRQPE